MKLDPDTVLGLVMDGHTDGAIARLYGVTRQAVSDCRRRHGIPTRRQTPTTRERVRELAARGIGVADIARELGIHYTTAYRALRVDGVVITILPFHRDHAHEAMWSRRPLRGKRRIQKHQIDQVRDEFLRGCR